MKLLSNINGVTIIDNFLNEADLKTICDQIESDTYTKIDLGVDKIYRLNSGEIYKNEKKYWSKNLPWNTGYDLFMTKLIPLFNDNNLVKFIKNLNISLKVHAYRPGAEIGWHQDSNSAFSYSYYCHKQWHPMWGGNLLIANQNIETKNFFLETNENNRIKLNDVYGEIYGARGITFDHSSEKILLDPGMGSFIMPIPNRLVIINNNVFHKVERVDMSAGSNCRLSLTGFIDSDENEG